ncbi:MAG: extracellular solute-binding protein [Blautia sp.]
MYYKCITNEQINITKGEVQNEKITNDGTFNERDGVNRVFAGVNTAQADAKTEITLWHYFSTEGSQQRLQEYVDEFNAQSDKTEVKVTVLPFADFKKQLTVGAAASSLPDLAMIDNCDTVSYAAMGILEDITDKVENWKSYQNYFRKF